MTSDEIKAAREVIDAATPGPWFADVVGYPWVSGPYDDNRDEHCTIVEWNETGDAAKADAAFIAASRTGWPAALSEFERLRGLLADAVGWMTTDVHRGVREFHAARIHRESGIE